MMFTETSISAMQASAATAAARREAKKPRSRSGRAILFGLLEVDQDGVGAEKSDHDRQKIDEVAQIDDAACNRAEVTEKARLREPADQPLRCPILKGAEHDRRARGGKDKDQSRSHDKSDDLVLGHRRNAGADCQHCSGHQPAGDVAREDDAIIWPAE